MEETTFYRFQSEVRAFLSNLLKHPVNAEPHKYLRDRDFGKKKLINILIKRGVLERHEKILDSTNSDEKEAKYSVKYKIRRKDFEKKIHEIYNDYFSKDEMNENIEMPLISRPIYSMGDKKEKKERKNMKNVYITESQLRMLTEFYIRKNRADVLNEEGEGAVGGDVGGATSTSSVQVQGSGDLVPGGKTTKKKTVGGFVDKGDGFFDSTTKSNPI